MVRNETAEQRVYDACTRDGGISFRSDGHKLLTPLTESTMTALRELLESRDVSATRPDLWLSHETEPARPIVELKSRGFSHTSLKPRRQALRMLASAIDLSPSLAETSLCPGHVLYVTIATDAVKLSRTLTLLAESLVSAGAQTAPYASARNLYRSRWGLVVSSEARKPAGTSTQDHGDTSHCAR